MQRSTALKKIAQLVGKSFGYRINDKAPTPEEREAARSALPAATKESNRLRDERDARSAALLAADSEYQALKLAAKEARDKVGRLSGMLYHYKITVGKSHGIFFSIMAEGDTWDEVVEKLTKKKEAA